LFILKKYIYIYYKRIMKTSNITKSFNSDRGNDIYTEGQRIIINVSPESAPLINTSDSYLMFSLLMGNDKTGAPNPNFVIPDPHICGCPFETLTVRSGDSSVVLEQLDSMQIFEGLKNYYGNDINDEHLQKVFSGRCDLVNKKYVSDNLPTPGAGTTRNWAISANGPKPPNRGGGFQSQYYKIKDTMLGDCARKTQIMYRFPMSGLLTSLKTELLQNILLGGIVIELTLMNSNKFLRVQGCEVRLAGTVKTQFGYGITDRTGVTDNIDITGGQQGFFNDATVNNQTYTATQSCYGFQGFYAPTVAAGVYQNNAPTTTALIINGLALKNSADGGTKFGIDDIQNCSIKVGSKIRVGYTLTGLGDTRKSTASLIDSVVTSVQMIGGRVHIRFPAIATDGVGGLTTGVIAVDNPVMCSLSSLGTPTFLNLAASFNTVSQLTINTARYEVADVEYVCNVVEAPQKYLEKMISQAQSGALKIQFNTYDDIRVNVPIQALSNEMMIPTDNSRCFSILGVNEVLQTQTILTDSISPSVDNLRDYIFILDGTRTPNQAVDLQRMASHRVSALAMIETEKALLESSIPLKDLRNPSKFITIGRRLGAYGSSVNLRGKTVKCRVNYSGTQPLSLLYHWFLYHTRSIQFVNGQLVVVS
jgi:hypothetical protein